VKGKNIKNMFLSDIKNMKKTFLKHFSAALGTRRVSYGSLGQVGIIKVFLNKKNINIF